MDFGIEQDLLTIRKRDGDCVLELLADVRPVDDRMRENVPFGRRVVVSRLKRMNSIESMVPSPLRNQCTRCLSWSETRTFSG